MYWWNYRTLGKNYLVQIWPQPDLQHRRIWLVLSRSTKKSLHLKKENCVSGKHSKLRLTGLTPGNAVGEKLSLFATANLRKLDVSNIWNTCPISIAARRKAGWVAYYSRNGFVKVDRRFTKEGQKIVLLVGNCPAHPSTDNLVSTELIFLPPNTTSNLQHMDQGVIRSLKAY